MANEKFAFSNISIGQKVRFDPFKEMTGFAVKDNQGKTFDGTVTLVNDRTKTFFVLYFLDGLAQRTSFKFSQIGTDVIICG